LLAARKYDDLIQNVGDLLDQLHQEDFELLIELIFSSSGWRRISSLGGIQKFFDMTLVLPTTGEKCSVRVKSQTNQAIFDGYIKELGNAALPAIFSVVPRLPSHRSAGPRKPANLSAACRREVPGISSREPSKTPCFFALVEEWHRIASFDFCLYMRLSGLGEVSSKRLTDELAQIEGGPWAEWGTGRRKKPITQNALARLLRPHHVSPVDVGPAHARRKGYKRDQFEHLFRSLPHVIRPVAPTAQL
jgi:Protein of unknown function (DUF3631)